MSPADKSLEFQVTCRSDISRSYFFMVLGFNDVVVSNAAHKPVPEKEKYEVVYPQKLHTQHKRDTESKYPDQVHYGLEINGKPLVLQLEKTEDLLSNYTETHYLDDGTPVTTTPEEQDHCYYQGQVKNAKKSQVSLSMCNGLSGLIITQEQKLLIEPLNRTEDGAHAVYEYQEQEVPKTCGVDDSMYNESTQTKVSFSTSDSEKKEFLKARKYIQLYVVADNSMFLKYNRNRQELQQRMFSIMNYVNLVYKPLNIFVALTGLEIWDIKDQFTVVTSANTNLDLFSKWRQTKLLPRKPNDNAQFLTNTDFDGATVGLAWVKTLCSETLSTGVVQDHTNNYIAVAATLAHEMGHNLGMDHDTNACYCRDESCIMAASLSYNTPKLFSACSHQHYQDFLLNNMPLCMKNRPKTKEILSPAVCGNKFTERGEECDCGTVEECTNKCCDAKTCKLKQGAQCAEGGCCSNCQLKRAGSVCRPAKDDCDLSDMCDGKSSMCPTDRFRGNGHPCRNGEGHCYKGKCPTLQGQCETYWGRGSYGASDSCFAINSRNSPGFCRQSGVNVYCAPQDVKCGVLFCSGGNDLPIVPGYGYYKQARCNSLNPQLLVEEGTKCGNLSHPAVTVCYPSLPAAASRNLALWLNEETPKMLFSEAFYDHIDSWIIGNSGDICMFIALYLPGWLALTMMRNSFPGFSPNTVALWQAAFGIDLQSPPLWIVCDSEMECQCEEGWAPPNCDTYMQEFNYGYIALIVILLVLLIVSALLVRRIHRRKQSRATGPSSGVANPTFNIQNQARQPPAYPTNPQLPAQSQKPLGPGMYQPPQPPAQSQKPFTPYGFQRPTTGPPPRPAYPSVPPQFKFT
ncbi:zinc metalloproteinase-disintegrin-like VLAIP-B [Gastrophryne carolinensis]